MQEQIGKALDSGDRELLKQLINECPDTNTKSISLIFLEEGSTYWDIVSLHNLAMGYFFSQNYESALMFSEICFYKTEQLINSGGLVEHKDLLKYLGDSAGFQLGSCLFTGNNFRGIETFEFINSRFHQFISNNKFGGFRLYAVSLFLDTNQIEKAINLMEQIELEENNNTEEDIITPTFQVTYEGLKIRIELLKKSITELSSTNKKTKSENGKESPENIAAEEYKKMKIFLEDKIPDWMPGLKVETDKGFDQLKGTTIDDISAINKGYNSFLELQEKLTETKFNENSIEKIRSQIQKLGMMLQDSFEGHDKEHLVRGVKKVDELIELLGERGIEDQLTLLWIKTICLLRIKRPLESQKTLTKLRLLLEAKRNSIKDINLRAGVFKPFPFFYNVLTEVSFDSNQYFELLFSIEASKGRSIIDKIASEKKQQNIYSIFEIPMEIFLRLLSENNAHYLSYFVDDDWSFVILLCNNGKIYAKKIPIGENQLKSDVNKTDPQNWNSGKTGFFGSKNDPTVELIPFVRILSDAEEEGNLKEGEHICYCPDGPLHLYPLHYIQYGDKYLIERFTLSKVHNAYQLIDLLQSKKNKKVNFNFLTAAAENDDNKMKIKFEEISLWFEKTKTKTMKYFQSEASFENIIQAMKTSDVLHLSTHGTFCPVSNSCENSENPFYNSGLLIYSNNKAPVRSDDNLDVEFLFTPELLTSNSNQLAKGCHVSLQACVSGRSKEGYGGDALGMEWAFFYTGTSSILSANWNVDLDYASEFFKEFYLNWIKNKCSKAEAHRNAAIKILRSNLLEDLPSPYYWAGFSLSGDWR